MRSFVKCEGAGNDFVLIDDRIEEFLTHDKETIQRLCHRRFGIGADGLILLRTPFKMVFFNSDGSEAATCGNGLRCFARFLVSLGFPPPYQIETAGQVVLAECVGEEIRVRMECPAPLKPCATLDSWEVHSLRVGVPHAVVFVPSVTSLDLGEVGSFVRHHPYFDPEGVNVNFAALQVDGSLAMRTFERGVEGETWACGTGAVAAVAVLGRQGPVRCTFPGGELTIEMAEGGVWMQGPARVVFRGVLERDDAPQG